MTSGDDARQRGARQADARRRDGGQAAAEQPSASQTARQRHATAEEPLRVAGEMGFPDSMPHAHSVPASGELRNAKGKLIPPPRESGQAGSNDITWEAGKSQPL